MIKLYSVMGPTGSGKSTVVNYMLNKVPDMERLMQYTTRPKRSENEVNADYMFVDDSVYDAYMAQSLVLSNRSYNVPSSEKKIWRYGIIMDEILKNVTIEPYDSHKSTYSGSFVMAANPSQISDIMNTLLSQDGIKYINKIQLNLIYIKTDPTVRLKNLYEREKSSTKNYDELLRRYIDDQEKVVPSCDTIYRVLNSLYNNRMDHDLMIGSVIAIPNDYSKDTFYILDSYINTFIKSKEND